MPANETVSALISALDRHRGNWPEIAASAEVSYSWLSKFANNHIPNPGVVTLDKLAAAIHARDHEAAA